MLADSLGPKGRFLAAKTMVSKPGGTTIAKLRETFGISRWTAMRMLREIAASGTPIEEEQHGTKKVFVVPSRSRDATITMTEFEMVGVAVAQQVASYLAGTPMFESLDAIFTKIEAALKAPGRVADLRRKIYDVNEGAMRFGKRDNANMGALLDALLRSHQVLIRHVTVENGGAAFLVDPLTLLFHRKGPYLVGRSHHPLHKGSVRKFAFDGIRSLKWQKGKSFDYPDQYHPRDEVRGAFGIVQGEPVTIRVRFHKSVERSIRRRNWHHTQKVGTVAGNSFIFEMRCAPTFEAVAWILGWGKSAEVIEPEGLRVLLAREAAAMHATYSACQ
jgi:proteasome accessory factor B